MLDNRLSAALSFIDEEDFVSDVGADHGYLSKAILDKGSKYVQVIENKIGPLNNAKKTLEGYNNVEFSLSSGFDNLSKKVDTAVICGMGGLNIVKIIDDNLSKVKLLKKLILGPNSKVYELRLYLYKNGFSIVDEVIAIDDCHFYNIMKVEPKEVNNYSIEELIFGPTLLKKQSNEFFLKYKRELKELNKILSNANLSKEDYKLLDEKKDMILKNVIGVNNEN